MEDGLDQAKQILAVLRLKMQINELSGIKECPEYKELAEARLFTTDQWADYLMFKNPAQRVFVDDRAMYDPQIIADALVIMDAAPGWRKAIDKYRINAVLCPAGTGISGQLEEDRAWKLVDSDETHMLFRAEAR